MADDGPVKERAAGMGGGEAGRDEARRGEPAEDGADPILAQLRAVYDAVAAEPLPERLVELLARLDAAERGR